MNQINQLELEQIENTLEHIWEIKTTLTNGIENHDGLLDQLETLNTRTHTDTMHIHIHADKTYELTSTHRTNSNKNTQIRLTLELDTTEPVKLSRQTATTRLQEQLDKKRFDLEEERMDMQYR